MGKIMTIAEFCDKHNACRGGREWAIANCKDMAEVWRTTKHDWLIWVATRPGVVDNATLRLFAVECARSVQYLLTDKRSINAIDVAYRYAIGEATDAELSAACSAAALFSDSRRATSSAAWAAARDAAWAAAWAAASYAARNAAHKAQDECLRGMATPNFEVPK